MRPRPEAAAAALLVATLGWAGCQEGPASERPGATESDRATASASTAAVEVDASTAPIVTQSLEIRFVEGAADSLFIEHACTGTRLAAFAAEEGGFVRGLVPTLGQERRIRRLDLDAPYMLNRDIEGRLYIADPMAGTQIDLQAFGPDAVRLFQPFLSEDADSGAS